LAGFGGYEPTVAICVFRLHLYLPPTTTKTVKTLLNSLSLYHNPLCFKHPHYRGCQAAAGHIHERLQVLGNMAIPMTNFNPTIIRIFEQKVTKIAKASAANTPHPHAYY
jgi:hypothetical protein